MRLRIVGAGLALFMLVLVGGCHSTSSGYRSAYPPCPSPCGTPCASPCNGCGAPAPPPGMVTAVPGS